jgi:N-acetylneuraminic acid mutarotase
MLPLRHPFHLVIPFGLVVVLAMPQAHAQGLGFFEARTALRVARQEVGAAALGGFLYVGGGLDRGRTAIASVERYDRSTNQWALVTPLPTTLHHFACAAAAGRVFALGGYDPGFGSVNAVWAYDPATNLWTARAPLPRARGAMVAVTIAERIYVVGGVVPGAGVVGELTVYEPATNTHTTLPPMPTAREHLAAAALDGLLFVAGGRAGGQLFDTLEVYDPQTNTWSARAPMPTPRGGTGAAAFGGKLYVFGGEGARIYPEVEEYDPATNTWRRVADLTTPVHGIYPVTLGDEVVVAGGGVVPGFGATAVVQSYRLLPEGVARFGTSTPACRGPIALEPTRLPIAGDSMFGFAALNSVAPNTAGVLALSATFDPSGTLIAGARIHVGLVPLLFLLPAASDAQGNARVVLPLPGNASGLVFFNQMAFLNTPTCGTPGLLHATDTLAVRVR